MKQEFKYYLLVSVVVVIFLLLGEALYRIFRLKAEYTRKIIHVLAGLIPISFPWLFTSHLPVLILNLQLLLLLIVSYFFSLLPSVNNISRRSLGSYIYPCSVYALFLLYLQLDNKIFFLLPIMILAISDPLAAISGMAYKAIRSKNPHIIYFEIGRHGKTIIGSLFFAISALLISLVMLPIYIHNSPGGVILLATVIALISTIAEAFSNQGLDNVTIPLSVVLALILFQFLFFCA